MPWKDSRMTLRALRLLAFCVAVSAPVAAQQLDLPRPSPSAKVSQTVGLTDISVDYSAPAVKGRKIWGAVVPYDKIWRAGANAVTKLTFSRDVSIVGRAVPAGSYAFFVIPGKTSWTLVLNKDLTQPGTGAGYKQEMDQLRVLVKPQTILLRERLAYQVVDFNDTKATLTLEWEKVRLSMPIVLATDAQVDASLKTFGEDEWRAWNNAARYELESKKDYDTGLSFVEKSLQKKETWLNVWTRAQLLAEKGRYKEAYPLAQKANDLGEKSPPFFLADEVKKALVDWKGK
jgi:hypothetical protein